MHIRRLLLALTFVVCGISAAEAKNVAFPPDNCSLASPFMSFNGPSTNENTYCSDGQFVLKNAIPECAADQIVSFDGSKFFCKTVATNFPVCTVDQVITYTKDGWECVSKTSQTVPTCAAKQFLTYNSTAFQCADLPALTSSVPTCGANQFLTYNGTTFQCADAPASSAAAATGAWCGARSFICSPNTPTYYGDRYQPKNSSYLTVNVPCNGQEITVTCASAPGETGDYAYLADIHCPNGYVGVQGVATASCIKP
jgi:hypothetical protein